MSVQENQWYIVDHGHDDKIVSGPWPDSTSAGAARTEMERGKWSRGTNLWIVSEHTLANMKEEK